jgi:hypothetical protein
MFLACFHKTLVKLVTVEYHSRLASDKDIHIC